MTNSDEYHYQQPATTAPQGEYYHDNVTYEYAYCWWCGATILVEFNYDGLCPDCRLRIYKLIDFVKRELRND